MKSSKVLLSLLLSLGLAMPLMAGSHTSQMLVAQANKVVKSITPKSLKKMIDNEDDLWMLDVREPYMIPEGSIDGPENIEIPRGVLEFDVESKIKDKNALVIVYCRSGKSAALAAKTLVEVMHYKNVRVLEGGLNGWLEAGYSIYSSFGEIKLAE